MKIFSSGVRQGSMLDPFLLNIVLSDLFLCTDYINFSSYVDVNTTYCGDNSISNVIMILEDSAEKFFQCFFDNQIKGNSNKYQILLSENGETQ